MRIGRLSQSSGAIASISSIIEPAFALYGVQALPYKLALPMQNGSLAASVVACWKRGWKAWSDVLKAAGENGTASLNVATSGMMELSWTSADRGLETYPRWWGGLNAQQKPQTSGTSCPAVARWVIERSNAWMERCKVWLRTLSELYLMQRLRSISAVIMLKRLAVPSWDLKWVLYNCSSYLVLFVSFCQETKGG